jgi:Clostridial hydrophobic W
VPQWVWRLAAWACMCSAATIALLSDLIYPHLKNHPQLGIALAFVIVLVNSLVFLLLGWPFKHLDPSREEIKSLRPRYSMLTYEEKVLLRDVAMPLGLPGGLNVGQLNLLDSIHDKTSFLRKVGGTYELKQESKEPLRALLSSDRTLKSKAKIIAETAGEDGNPSIGIKVTVKPEGKRRQTFQSREFAGTREPRALEGFELEITPRIPGLGLKYMGHFEGFGDSDFVHDGEFITTPTARRLEGFAIELTRPANHKYDVHYMARIQSPLDNTDEFKNGEFCGTRGRSLRIEGISVWILPRPI